MSRHLIALGEYLRARRDVTAPEDAGLPREAGRRVPGLRRDEVAMLAGISPEYYLRLEQGRGARPSDQVLNAIARALLLDQESRLYLFRLATGSPPPAAPVADRVAEQIARVLSRWTHTPAYMSDPHRDIVAANPMAAAFGHGGLSAGSNQVVNLFNDRMKATLVEWESMTRSAVATLRRDAHPDSPRLREIVDELSSDPDFVRIWARHDVSGPEDAVFHIAVDGLGEIAVEGQNFGVRSLPGYQLTVMAAPPGSITEAVFSRMSTALTAAPA
ncbi:helix-turn-helix domain-containing protein [Microbacterium trichothecenolyticum]|uniref:Helix-turn-helix domain-containing protein n=1 Tax=Microbacterium ureisolvens TaxID=2781186 RepID=A0ABS7I1J5_9MICO|nr:MULTISPECIES: helix-turn-helix transcriptional regulator [Microbacterium]MBW9110705.1 helix-turn-helix domain-containing protein [Microbacterium ureisolvens]MBW9119569.1 helix-turn-helix domain-containing protein [Microbacterium trichothecenolyticum]